MAFSTILLFTFLNNFTGDGTSAGFLNISIYFNISINQTSGLLSWFVLVLGLSNFFWIPTAAYIGKRPTFLTSCTIVFVCAIWGACSKSFGSLLASTVIGGFGGGASEAVGAAIVNDLYFLHERGKMMGIYMLAISWGSSIGPLIGGFLIQKLGWQWQKWLSCILLGVNLLMIFFFLPETRFRRALGRKEYVSSDSRYIPSAEKFTSEGMSVDKEAGANGREISPSTSSERVGGLMGSKKTKAAELNPWSGIDRNTNWLNHFLRPFPLVVYPACLFAVLACKHTFNRLYLPLLTS